VRVPDARASRARFAAVLGIVAPLGLLTKLYAGPGAHWVGAQAGGLLYVVFWSFAALALRPRWSPARVTVAVAVATSLLEFSQLWHPPFLVGLRASFLGHALLGSTFAWLDFPYYGAGALAAYALARALAERA
jgi:hypothetical protein